MSEYSRRGFLRASSGIAAGSALGFRRGANADPAEDVPKISRYKPFGRTGWSVGDISAGAGQRDPAMVEQLIERGINLIDTAYQYPGHEEIIGKVLHKWRDKVFIVDKWDPPLVSAKVTKAELLEALDVSLKRLGTDYIDCMMIHSIGRPSYGGLERIQNPAIHEAWDEAKKSGKIRFTGASSHGVRMLEDIGWGIDNDRFDVVLVGANFLTRGLEPLLKKARAKGVATMAMKTMTIYKADLNIRELQDQNTNARQAVIKWILASDLFDTMIVGMRNYDQINEYLSVSGTTSLSLEDRSRLEILEAAATKRYCRPGCDGCLGSCPADVPIWDILRYKMYFENYGDQKYAMNLYRQLPASQTVGMCVNCPAPCDSACRYGLPVRERLLEAHRQLTLA